ncbi:response regulator [Herbaspirillum rubrisubalbicans]|uniref:Response regulator n=1 Tax=Herbaspirillum rubrisubalbicans TaxID=80842 RepID=A0AAD0XHE8_9BURK|nr:response regulator [Herbaspirillum rubrisubalbicans]ALU90390.1 sensory transduction regulatory protein [Herbaspirillum rubrisubalbicans M1]AYR25417.1 response regulator [Herbaspirillum rubrisubalbicans]
MKPPIILMIESNGEAVELARFALWRHNFHCVLQWIDEADIATESLLQHGRRESDSELPRMIFLDPGMMENNGLGFIQAMKAGRSTRAVPIVVFPDSDYPPEMPELIDAGAVEYLLKPETAQQFMQAVVDRARYWSDRRRRRRTTKAATGKNDEVQ